MGRGGMADARRIDAAAVPRAAGRVLLPRHQSSGRVALPLAINLLGAWLFLGGEAGLVQLARNSVGSVASFSLTPIPLFILMGEVLFHTGLAVKVDRKSTRLNSS